MKIHVLIEDEDEIAEHHELIYGWYGHIFVCIMKYQNIKQVFSDFNINIMILMVFCYQANRYLYRVAKC